MRELEARINTLKAEHSEALLESMRAQAARDEAAKAMTKALEELRREFDVDSIKDAADLYRKMGIELEGLLLEAEAKLNNA